ncbi:MAG: hypothetical protein E7168_03800 [Firmicutes bacterium]|nr:hypothetical protein [Bacillota bacterium]
MNIFQKITSRIVNYVGLQRKYNRLQNEYDSLVEITKSELLESIIQKSNEAIQLKKLKTENKNLREKIKVLKEIIKSDKETE